MQGVTVDAEHKPKLQNDEDVLNLRPSPNYKHKKYLSSKFEESMMIQAKSELNSKRENVSVVTSVAAQPPLPPNPPPPDSPPMIMKLKEEIEDDEYSSSNPETATEFKQPDEAETENATIKTDLSEKGTMCRNFARGTCRKGTACRFLHELILSQLPGVYTFCRNFQNSVCSFPKCKFVHATVFEKEHFFRTGYLPPHTLAHLAEPSVLQPPPPPPQSEEAAIEQPPVYTNAPLSPSSISCVENVVQYNAENGVQQSESNIFNAVQMTSTTTSPKLDWSDIDDDASSSPHGELLPRKCKNCPRSIIREQLLKREVERRTRENQELIQKIAELDKQNAVIAAMLEAYKN